MAKSGMLGGEIKLVLCVRTDLKMSVGKIVAQCCHATLGISFFTFDVYQISEKKMILRNLQKDCTRQSNNVKGLGA